MSIVKWKTPKTVSDVPVWIGKDIFDHLNKLIKDAGICGKGIGVWEDDTFRRMEKKPAVFRNVIFDNEQLFCDNQSLEYLRKQSVEEGDFYIGVGGEAIQSITRLVAKESRMPCVAVPTCAYGIGISSPWVYMGTSKGMVRIQGAVPEMIVIDTGLMAEAKESFVTGAIRELIDRAGMYARIRAQAIAAGYDWNQECIETETAMMDEAFHICNSGLRRKEPEAFEIVCKALITCGLADGQRMEIIPNYPARLNFLSEYCDK